MTKTLTLWLVVGVLTTLSYFPAVRHLAIQHPYSDKIIISNLTLNLVILLGAVGALSPWITKKLFHRKSLVLVTVVAVVLAVLVVLTLKALGMSTRI